MINRRSKCQLVNKQCEIEMQHLRTWLMSKSSIQIDWTCSFTSANFLSKTSFVSNLFHAHFSRSWNIVFDFFSQISFMLTSIAISFVSLATFSNFFYSFFLTYESCDKWKYRILEMNIETCRINEDETTNKTRKAREFLTMKRRKNIQSFPN